MKVTKLRSAEPIKADPKFFDFKKYSPSKGVEYPLKVPSTIRAPATTITTRKPI